MRQLINSVYVLPLTSNFELIKLRYVYEFVVHFNLKGKVLITTRSAM